LKQEMTHGMSTMIIEKSRQKKIDDLLKFKQRALKLKIFKLMRMRQAMFKRQRTEELGLFRKWNVVEAKLLKSGNKKIANLIDEVNKMRRGEAIDRRLQERSTKQYEKKIRKKAIELRGLRGESTRLKRSESAKERKLHALRARATNLDASVAHVHKLSIWRRKRRVADKKKWEVILRKIQSIRSRLLLGKREMTQDQKSANQEHDRLRELSRTLKQAVFRLDEEERSQKAKLDQVCALIKVHSLKNQKLARMGKSVSTEVRIGSAQWKQLEAAERKTNEQKRKLDDDAKAKKFLLTKLHLTVRKGLARLRKLRRKLSEMRGLVRKTEKEMSRSRKSWTVTRKRVAREALKLAELLADLKKWRHEGANKVYKFRMGEARLRREHNHVLVIEERVKQELLVLRKERLKELHLAGAVRKQARHELEKTFAMRQKWKTMVHNELNRKLRSLAEVSSSRKQLRQLLRSNQWARKMNAKLRRKERNEHKEKVHVMERMSAEKRSLDSILGKIKSLRGEMSRDSARDVHLKNAVAVLESEMLKSLSILHVMTRIEKELSKMIRNSKHMKEIQKHAMRNTKKRSEGALIDEERVLTSEREARTALLAELEGQMGSLRTVQSGLMNSMVKVLQLRKELAGEAKSSLEEKEILAKQRNSLAVNSTNWGRKKLQDQKLLIGLIQRRALWYKQMRELKSKMNYLMINLRANEHGLYGKLGKEKLESSRVLQFVRQEMAKLRKKITLLAKMTGKLAILASHLGKERHFKLHELVQHETDHKHLENALKMISARLKNMQSKFANGKHEEKKILNGYKVREGILVRSLKRERGEEMSAVAKLRAQVMEEKSKQMRFVQIMKELVRLRKELRKRKHSTSRELWKLRKAFKSYSADLMKLKKLRTLLALQRQGIKRKLHQKSHHLQRLKIDKHQKLSLSRRDDEDLLRKKELVLVRVHRLLRKLAHLRMVERVWETKAEREKRKTSEIFKVLKNERERNFHIQMKLKKIEQQVDASAQRSKRKRRSLDKEMENAEGELRRRHFSDESHAKKARKQLIAARRSLNAASHKLDQEREKARKMKIQIANLSRAYSSWLKNIVHEIGRIKGSESKLEDEVRQRNSNGKLAVDQLKKEIMVITKKLSKIKKKHKSSLEHEQAQLAIKRGQLERHATTLLKIIKEEETRHTEQMKALKNKSHSLAKELMDMRRHSKAVAREDEDRQVTLTKDLDRLKKRKQEQQILMHSRTHALKHGMMLLARGVEKENNRKEEARLKYNSFKDQVMNASRHELNVIKTSLKLLSTANKLKKLLRKGKVEARKEKMHYIRELSSENKQMAKRGRKWRLKQEKWRRNIEAVLRQMAAVAKRQDDLKKKRWRFAKRIAVLKAEIQEERKTMKRRSKVLSSEVSGMISEKKKDKIRDMQEAAKMAKQEVSRVAKRAKLARGIQLILHSLAEAKGNMKKMLARIVRERQKSKNMLAKLLLGWGKSRSRAITRMHLNWLQLLRRHQAHESQRFRELVKEVVKSAHALRMEQSLVELAGQTESKQLKKMKERGKRCLVHAKGLLKTYLRELESESKHVSMVVAKIKMITQRILRDEDRISKYANRVREGHEKGVAERRREDATFKAEYARYQKKVGHETQERALLSKAQSQTRLVQHSIASEIRLLQKELLESHAQGEKLLQELNSENVKLKKIYEAEERERVRKEAAVKAFAVAASKNKERVDLLLGATETERNVISRGKRHWAGKLRRLRALQKNMNTKERLKKGKAVQLSQKIKNKKARVQNLKNRSKRSMEQFRGDEKKRRLFFRNWKNSENGKELKLSATIHGAKKSFNRGVAEMHDLKKLEERLLSRLETKRRETDMILRNSLASARRTLQHAVERIKFLLKQRRSSQERELRRWRTETGMWLRKLKKIHLVGVVDVNNVSRREVELRKKFQKKAKKLALLEHKVLVDGLKHIKGMSKVDRLEMMRMKNEQAFLHATMQKVQSKLEYAVCHGRQWLKRQQTKEGNERINLKNLIDKGTVELERLKKMLKTWVARHVHKLDQLKREAKRRVHKFLARSLQHINRLKGSVNHLYHQLEMLKREEKEALKHSRNTHKNGEQEYKTKAKLLLRVLLRKRRNFASALQRLKNRWLVVHRMQERREKREIERAVAGSAQLTHELALEMSETKKWRKLLGHLKAKVKKENIWDQRELETESKQRVFLIHKTRTLKRKLTYFRHREEMLTKKLRQLSRLITKNVAESHHRDVFLHQLERLKYAVQAAKKTSLKQKWEAKGLKQLARNQSQKLLKMRRRLGATTKTLQERIQHAKMSLEHLGRRKYDLRAEMLEVSKQIHQTVRFEENLKKVLKRAQRDLQRKSTEDVFLANHIRSQLAVVTQLRKKLGKKLMTMNKYSKELRRVNRKENKLRMIEKANGAMLTHLQNNLLLSLRAMQLLASATNKLREEISHAKKRSQAAQAGLFKMKTERMRYGRLGKTKGNLIHMLSKMEKSDEEKLSLLRLRDRGALKVLIEQILHLSRFITHYHKETALFSREVMATKKAIQVLLREVGELKTTNKIEREHEHEVDVALGLTSDETQDIRKLLEKELIKMARS